MLKRPYVNALVTLPLFILSGCFETGSTTSSRSISGAVPSIKQTAPAVVIVSPTPIDYPHGPSLPPVPSPSATTATYLSPLPLASSSAAPSSLAFIHVLHNTALDDVMPLYN